MKNIGFYLSSCSTCSRIIKELALPEGFRLKDIKTDPMTEEEVDHMAQMAGSFESLFSRRAMKYRAWGLNEKQLTEADYRDLIVKEYTFLKRPVFIIGGDIFVGNTKKVIQAAKDKLKSL
ncbi:MAG: ArsC/Spx/MgsR family protein [Bacteroidota bacterium]